MPSDPQTNMNAAEDFLLLVLHAHTIVAAEVILKHVSVTSVLSELAARIVTNYVYLPPPSSIEETEVDPPVDGVHFYAVELLSLSLIWHGFHDAIREGDGERIKRKR